ncbi:MAG: lytic transglycosylase domain-containing protein [Desulfovibrionaceae bacterium]|jgi:soluble lytic murein transglycosylase-like protein|nr:lytic transglycosylase domain-containing protein [Desulfovibrionaceae bacterium]
MARKHTTISERRPAAPWRAVACAAALALLAGGLWPQAARAEATFFYYRDEAGVFHFTNVPDSPRYGVFAVFRGHPEVSRDEIVRLAKKYSGQYGLDHHLVQAVIEVESGYDSGAVSPAGAEGLMQIMPDTQREVGVNNSFDPAENIRGGVRYLRKMYDRFGRWDLALAAYNAGPQQVERYRGVPPFQETRYYVSEVLKRYNRIRKP